MKKLFTLVFSLIALIASAQNTFETAIFDSIHNGHPQKMIQLKDSTYVVLGYHGAFDTGYYFIKLNSKGTILAQKKIEVGFHDFMNGVVSITATSEGGFAVMGALGYNVLGLPVFFAKYDSNLNQTIALSYSLPASSGVNLLHFPSKMLQTPDGGFLICGGATGYAGTGYFFKIRNDGSYVANSLQILNVPPQILQDNGRVAYTGVDDMVLTKDGNILLLCDTYFANTVAGRDVEYIVKATVSENGVLTTQWVLGYSVPEILSLYPTSDSGFIFTSNQIVSKANSLGNVIWSKSINFSTTRFIKSVVEPKNGGYVVAGYANALSAGSDTTIGYLIQLDKNGNWQWNKTFRFRDSATTDFLDVIPTYDGGFAAAGEIGNVRLSKNSDILICKFDSAFNTCNPLFSDTTNPIADFGLYVGGGHSFQSLNVDSLQIDTISFVYAAGDFSCTNSCSEILPVQLLSFNAILQNKTVNVAWKTTNEVNTDHFVVERSSEARTFTDLQTITAKGNGSTNVESYAITDLQPLQGTSYYRLREVDKEGKITYSNVVSVTILANGMLIISPNPVHDNVHVLLQSRTSGQATFVVTDVTGKIVTKQKNNIIEGTNTFQIPAASLSKGLYVLKVIQNNAVLQSVKFIKQ